MPTPTFEEDVAFMRQYGAVQLLAAPEGGQVALSAQWQARVMTSCVRPGGRSLGFVNRSFLDAGKTGTPFDNYGGEDRFWLGPEGGQFGLYFAPHAPFAIDTWQVPHDVQEGAWSTDRATPRSIAYSRTMRLVSRAEVEFQVQVAREVTVLDAKDVEARFGVAPPAAAGWVAFETTNRITNAGPKAWTQAEGLLSVWILGQFRASAGCAVIVPFLAHGEGPVANDAYFGEVPADRLALHPRDGVLTFKADGEHRSKIGIGPGRAKPMLGSYDREADVLTLVRYALPPGKHGYVNSMWELQKDPYAGDVINSYNDGPIGADKTALGHFYELETSSPAAALAPGESLTHTHATLHLVAPMNTLDPVARQILGASLTIAPGAGGSPGQHHGHAARRQ